MTSGRGKRIKPFRKYVAEGKSTYTVFYHFEITDRVAEVVVRLLLNESKPYVELGKGRAILHHKAHIPDTQDHLHFRVKGTNIAAINKDGSAHDKSHGVMLQKWATNGAKKYFPDFHIPDDGLIESIFCDEVTLLTEEADHGQVVLSPDVQSEAEQAVE
ncbi:conserved hypothetical protein [Roseovarius sp. EC-HK134]|uniref:hypothetical protein n=1 Tax=unclassified Roseovarius TaxID=2614913 RepID=UPI0012546931|nr:MULTISPECIES: hypothetical protein [unclassified Roseovarius]VVT32798.1 conserved hypothetical protein [Roseovarius sp. EC-HK134]VVT32882.1 conserved hypothetical protein [Roseovarius sp. EC-SD190]